MAVRHVTVANLVLMALSIINEGGFFAEGSERRGGFVPDRRTYFPRRPPPQSHIPSRPPSRAPPPSQPQPPYHPQPAPGPRPGYSSPPQCVQVPGRSSGYSPYGISVAHCEALLDVERTIEDLTNTIEMVNASLTDHADHLGEQLDNVERDVGSLKGEGELADTVIITKDSSNYFRLCQVNSMVEVTEMCRIIDGKGDNVIVDPFFFHLNCRSSRARDANLTCPGANQTWLVKPNCLKPSVPFDEIFDCFSMNERPCENVFFFHCFGFTDNITPQRTFFTFQQHSSVSGNASRLLRSTKD